VLAILIADKPFENDTPHGGSLRQGTVPEPVKLCAKRIRRASNSPSPAGTLGKRVFGLVFNLCSSFTSAE
jgi:hypothetical protein